MAKSTNGLGQFRGKMGGVVFSVRNGQQVIRTYQPVVANPKSSEQRIQRAKAVLAGKLSHLLTSSLIIGMNGGSKAGRRSEFNRVLLDSIDAQISSTTGNTKAVLVPEKLIFSQGPNVYATSREQNPIVISESNLRIVWNHNSDAFSGQLRVIVIASHYNSVSSDYEWRVFENVVNASAGSITIPIPSNWVVAGTYGDVFAYAVPIFVDEETLHLNGSPLVSRDSLEITHFIASLIATESSSVSYAATEFIGASEVSYA